MAKTKSNPTSLKSKKTGLLMIAAVAVGLLVVAAGAFAVSSFNWNRFGGIWHLQKAGVLPENGSRELVTLSLGNLDSCSEPTRVSNNTPDPHYESQCFYMNISNIRRQAFKLYIFKNEDAKIRYYGSDLGRHPCRLGETPLIESELYVMRPEANLTRKQERVEAIYAKLKKFDKAAVMLQKGNPGSDYTSCDDHIESIARQYRRIGAGTAVKPDTEIDRRCAALQVSVDSVYTDNPIAPAPEAFADCLDLRGAIRSDFIDSLVILDKDNQSYVASFASYGWYSPSEGPVVEWYSFDTAAGLALVAMHEYLHKVYFEDLSSAERIKLNQEILRLIDTDDPGGLLPAVVFPQEQWDKLSLEEKIALNPYGCSNSSAILADTGLCADGDRVYHNSEYSVFIDYLGQDSLNNEVMIRVGRHSPSPRDFVKTRDTLRSLEAGIPDRRRMAEEMLAALPPEIRPTYAAFLLDDYGLIAFMREVREITELEELIQMSEEESSEDGPDGFDVRDPEGAEDLDKLSYDKRLAGNTGETSLKEALEEIFLSHYEYRYGNYYDYEEDYPEPGPEPDYEAHDSFSISRYIAQAACAGPAGPDCEDDEASSETEVGCDPAAPGCEEDYREVLKEICQENPEEQICSFMAYCEQNEEAQVCQLFEYCLAQVNAGNPSDVDEACYMVEHCASDPEMEICQPDWPDEEHCLENIGDEACWPGLEDLYDEPPPRPEPPSEEVEECYEDEDGNVECQISEPEDRYIEEDYIPILDREIYGWHLDAILIEGYPIIALEVKEVLPSWFERHFDRFLEDRQNIADYFRRRS